MKIFKMWSVFMLLIATAYGQGKYTFSKVLNQPSIGDWIKFGQIDGPASGTVINVKTWAHFDNQLFFEEFEIAATSYGNANLDWVEVAPRLTNAFDGRQNFALDAKYKCRIGCPLELRLRRLFGGGSSGSINFVVESNAPFTESDLQGNNGVVHSGYLGNNGGWKFPVSSQTFSNSLQGLFVDAVGNVSIGTTDAKSFKLAVAGGVLAESVTVKLQAAWPDYVFGKSYSLSSLPATERYIADHGHLPGMPAASVVLAEGIDLAKMNVKLLEKIEELTLHLIAKDKIQNRQQRDLTMLQKEVSRLKQKNKLK